MVYDFFTRSFVGDGGENIALQESKEKDISSKPTQNEKEQASTEAIIPESRMDDWEEDEKNVKKLSSARDAILESRTQDDEDVDSSRKLKPKQGDKYVTCSASAPNDPILLSRSFDEEDAGMNSDVSRNSKKTEHKPDVVEKVLECDYDKETNLLYSCIQQKRHHVAYKILTTDETVTPMNLIDMIFEDLGFPQKKKLSRRVILSSTWVVRKNNDGSIRWRQLPLHAAILFDTPYKVLKQLVEVYPQAAKLPDDQGNLPLHLAFRVGLCEEKINILVKAYLDGVLAKNNKGKTPIEVGAEHANKRAIVGCVTKAIEAERAKAQGEMNLMQINLREERDAEIARLKEEQIKLREERDAEITKLKEERDEEISNVRQSCKDQIDKLREDFTSAVTKMKKSSSNDQQQQSTAAARSSGMHQSLVAIEQTPPRDPPPMME